VLAAWRNEKKEKKEKDRASLPDRISFISEGKKKKARWRSLSAPGTRSQGKGKQTTRYPREKKKKGKGETVRRVFFVLWGKETGDYSRVEGKKSASPPRC